MASILQVREGSRRGAADSGGIPKPRGALARQQGPGLRAGMARRAHRPPPCPRGRSFLKPQITMAENVEDSSPLHPARREMAPVHPTHRALRAWLLTAWRSCVAHVMATRATWHGPAPPLA